MSYYEDVLDAEDKLLQVAGHAIDEPHKADAIKPFAFKIKSSPDANTSIALGQDVSRGKTEGQLAYKQKVELKRTEGEFDLKWVVTSKDYEFTNDWKPKDLNDGMETVVSSGLKIVPKGDTIDWSAKFGVNNSGHKLGPIVPYFGFQFDTNKQSEHELEIHQNFVYEKDIHVASRTVLDVNNKNIKEAQGLLAWKNQEFGQVWFRSNCKANFMGLGWQGKVNGYKTAAELQYDMKKANLGLGGQPLWFKLGSKFNTTNGGTISTSLNSGENHIVSSKYEVPIAKNLKISYSDRVDAVKFFTDPANAGYTSGFNVEMKI